MASHIDYKFRSIHRTGGSTFVTMTVYEGADALVDGNMVYGRTKLAETHHLRFRGDVADDELRAFCNKRLVALTLKYAGRVPHPAQVVGAASKAELVAERVDEKR